MKTWVKLYTEINRDPKFGSLTWAQRGMWAAMLALAGQIDDVDDTGATGLLGTLSDVCWHLRMTQDELQDAMDAFTSRDMVYLEDGKLYLTHFPERQKVPPSAERSVVTERVRQYRARMKRACNEPVTSAQQNVTSSDPDPDTESETEGEKTVDGAVAPLPDGSLPIIPFQNWLDDLQKGPNRSAVAVRMYTALYPGRDPPDYGRIGQTAKRIGGWALLARYLWFECTRPPVGCVLDYIEARHKAGGYRGGNENSAADNRVHPHDRQVGPVIHR